MIKKILIATASSALLLSILPNSSLAFQDTTKTEITKTKIKPYKDVVKNALTTIGMFNVHKLKDKYYFEIPNYLLNREMLMVSRLSKTPKGIKHGGEQLSEQVMKWERVEDRVYLRLLSYSNVITRDSSMQRALDNSNVSPIYADFDILAENKDKNSIVIDVTAFTKGDDVAFGLSDMMKKMYQIGAIELGKSYVNTIKSYPSNIEINSTKTYKIPSLVPASVGGGRVTLEINNSLILLPENPMMPRLEDRRVGYFAQKQTDFGLNEQGIAKTSYIRRWRLEPKDPEAYFAGKLSDPVKPIVFYIDPATPQKWVPYLKQGVQDWNKAFEAAGFKNAIFAKDAPTYEQDSTWNVNDTRHSVIRYFASETENAYGPHVADPRTGEILSSHIGWYHNVMNLIKSWYFIQTAAVNPASQPRNLSDETMGKLIRYIAAHEVGHTIGLPHNFISSNAVPVDSLRSKSYTDKYGTTPSIMDYARFNYVAQPEDNVQNLMPQIGPYDEYSVNWGYRKYQSVNSPQDELSILNKLIVEKAHDPAYKYSKQLGMFDRQNDPRAQTEDLGDNAMKASGYGIKNLQRLLPNLHKITYLEGDNYDHFADRYNKIFTQWNMYLGHVQSYVSGIYEDHKSMDQEGAVYSPVPANIQIEAIEFLNQQLFTTPKWLIQPSIVDKLQGLNLIDKVTRVQTSFLGRLMNLGNFNRINEWSIRGNHTFSVPQLLDVLNNQLFDPNVELDNFRKTLQRTYISYLKAYSLKYLDNAIYNNDRSTLGLAKSFPKDSDYPNYADVALKKLEKHIVKAKNTSSKDGIIHYAALLKDLK